MYGGWMVRLWPLVRHLCSNPQLEGAAPRSQSRMLTRGRMRCTKSTSDLKKQ